MGVVMLKKRSGVNEEEMVNVQVSDPNIQKQIAQLNDAIARAEKQYNDTVTPLKQKIAALQKQDAAKQAQSDGRQGQSQQQSNQQDTNESLKRVYAESIRRSRRLYESVKSRRDDLTDLLIDMFADMDLSYSVSDKECKNIARKMVSVLDGFDVDDGDVWPDVEDEIRLYFKNNGISLSRKEKDDVIDSIRECIKSMPEYEWVFGDNNDSLAGDIAAFAGDDEITDIR